MMQNRQEEIFFLSFQESNSSTYFKIQKAEKGAERKIISPLWFSDQAALLARSDQC